MSFGYHPKSRPLLQSERAGYAEWEKTLAPTLTRWRYLEEAQPDETFGEWKARMIAAGMPETAHVEKPSKLDREFRPRSYIINVRGRGEPPPVVL